MDEHFKNVEQYFEKKAFWNAWRRENGIEFDNGTDEEKNLMREVDFPKWKLGKTIYSIGLSPSDYGLGMLLSTSPDAKKIRSWFFKKLSNSEGEVNFDGRMLSQHEAFLVGFSNLFIRDANDWLIPEWHKIPMQKKRIKCESLARKCLDIKRIMEKDLPGLPPAIAFFSEENIGRFLKDADLELSKLPPRMNPRYLIKLNGPLELNSFEFAEKNLPESSIILSRYLSGNVGDFLSSLAEYLIKLPEFEKEYEKKSKVTPQKLFAIEVKKYFLTFFGCCSDTIIACAVNLKFPDLEEPWTNETAKKSLK